jgi:hypothetical protein
MGLGMPLGQMDGCDGVQNIEPPEDSDEHSVVVDHRKALDVLVYHQLGRAPEHGIRRNRDDLTGHHFGNLAVRIFKRIVQIINELRIGRPLEANRYVHASPRQQIAVAHHPNHPALLVRNRDCREILAQQQFNHFSQGAVGAYGGHIAPHNLGDLHVRQAFLQRHARLHDLDLLNGDQRMRRHLAQRSYDSIHSLGPVHDRDQHRQIHRQSKDCRGVNNRRSSESRNPAYHRGAAAPLAPEHLDDRRIQCFVMVQIGLRDEDSELLAFSGKHHR